MGIASSVFMLESVIQMVFNISIAFAAISALDYAYQWWDYERQIKMSKHDIKEEFKQMEGNPQIKRKDQGNTEKNGNVAYDAGTFSGRCNKNPDALRSSAQI